MNRFDRITAILIQLQSKKIVKAQELADRFEISLRTVYRDMNSLVESGVPLVSEAGIGYSLVDGYRLPPVMFTKEEARSFIAAEKLVEQFTDLEVRNNYRSAMFKVKAVLKGKEKDMVENLADHVLVRNLNTYRTLNSNCLDQLLLSITDRKVLLIDYWALSTNVHTERKIEPVGIYHENNMWYTIAYCHLRGEYRNFRADRIQKIQTTQQHFDLQHAPLAKFLERQTETGSNLTRIVIDLDQRVANYIQDRKYFYGFISEEQFDNTIRMTFLSPNLREFARWYLMLATDGSIIEPEALKVAVRSLLEEINVNL